MSAFLVYIIKWTICLAVLYIPFTLLLRKETFASLNRMLLLGTVVVSALLPWAEIHFTVVMEAPANIVAGSNIATTAIQGATTAIEWENIILAIYLAGVAFTLLGTAMGITKAATAIRRGTLWTEQRGKAIIHCHADTVAPFSWFNHIVISESDYNECGKEILLHEEGHILHRHSLDILLLAAVKAFQWFNPFIYMLENDIKEIHEYEADRYVMEHSDNARDYQLLILKKAASNAGTQLINRFSQSSVRKRITMMARKESDRARLAKWLYLIPATSLLLLLFAKPQYIYSYKKVTADVAATHTKEETAPIASPRTTVPPAPVPAKKKKRATVATKAVQQPTDTITATAPATTEKATTPQESVTAIRYASETYYGYMNLQDNDTAPGIAKSDIRRCSVRASFIADNNGQAGDIAIKGCDISLNTSNENIADNIELIRSAMIASAEEYIKQKEWASAIVDGEKANTIYDAHIIYRHGKAETQQASRRPMLVGSTPIN